MGTVNDELLPVEDITVERETVMSSTRVREALAIRWPDGEYLRIEEAPQDSSRQGRKIDLLVISLWRSRGLERDAVEIKVSLSDVRRELKEAAKADFWWEHSHRFWLACPADLAKKVREDLPSTWGLLAVTPDKVRTLVKAPAHTPKPLPWATTVGVLRAADGAGVNALQRARSAGYTEGAKYERERRPEASVMSQQDAMDLQNLRAFRDQVREFEEASGIKIGRSHAPPLELGRAVQMVAGWGGPAAIAEHLERQAGQLSKLATELVAVPDKVAES